MHTRPEIIDQADQTAPAMRKEWAEPQIMIERPLEANAQYQPSIPTPPEKFPGHFGPLGTSGGLCWE
jgi:hypothetical protein